VLPGLDTAAIERFCERRIPPHVRDQLRLELVESRGAITIVERRAPWRAELGPDWTSLQIARFRYSSTAGLWTLYWQDSSERWHRYGAIGPTPNIQLLLDEVDRDPSGIFWG
jgi:hypothetical protein